MKLATVCLVALSTLALAAPTAPKLVARDNTLYISGSNATELAKEYAPVYSLAPNTFAADDVQQPMGFLDFSGYVQFISGLLFTASDFFKAASQAVTDVSINELNTAITNAIMGFLKYLNAFLEATKQGTRFDKAVYAFIINSGFKDFLTNVGMWLVNLSNKILGSPLLQGVVDLLKKLWNWIFGGKQTVQKALGNDADMTGFNRAQLAINSLQSAAEQKINKGN
ncbi:hypothetical protein CJU90_5080 [Yarrowia sp. C11]|nr:hypothetical protein CJU90_5080 [Yarrowia sp. C11]KAG5364882.1 hypothetical protein CKK34_3708 [Yarrowia sp. E02]